MKREFKPGDLVRVLPGGSTHEGQIGTVTARIGSCGYPNDLWINFESGQSAPYGSYELELVTKHSLELELARMHMRLEYLEGKGE